MMTEEIEIRLYGFSEFALLYNPQMKPRSAVRILNKWIDWCPGLRERLEALGFRRGMRTLSPQMVRVILDALDEP